MEYYYKFADGDEKTIEINKEWMDILKESDREIERSDKKEHRHTCSLSQMKYEGKAFSSTDTNLEHVDDPKKEESEEKKRKEKNLAIRKTYESLSDAQKDLFQKVFIEGMTQTDYAKLHGVSQQAIADRISRIKKIFKKFLR